MFLQEVLQLFSFQFLQRCWCEGGTSQGGRSIFSRDGFLDFSCDGLARSGQDIRYYAVVIGANGVHSSISDAGKYLTV